jgi:nucleoside-diphosphate-sugar epimerase
VGDTDFNIEVAFAKAFERAPDRRLVGGFAYVSKKNGEILFDTQGDAIDPEDLRDAVHEFIKSGRSLGIMHIENAGGQPVQVGEIVEMAVLAGDFMPESMSKAQEGLWMVAKVTDDHAWDMIKDGTLRGFSIGGRGVRVAA